MIQHPEPIRDYASDLVPAQQHYHHEFVLEIAGLWPHLMRDVPALQGRDWYAYALVNDAQAMKIVLFVFFLFFLSRLFSSSSLSFLQLNTINYDLHLHII